MRIVIERMGHTRPFSGKMLEEPIVVDICKNDEFPKHIISLPAGKRKFEGDPCKEHVVDFVPKSKGTIYKYPKKKCDEK